MGLPLRLTYSINMASGTYLLFGNSLDIRKEVLNNFYSNNLQNVPYILKSNIVK
jgi:hypothetical protein